MSVVKKMIVQGVRSFHPEDSRAQMIEFQTPLTLIVGINGSGKTTIIEALKYAITNKFPPNCTNGSSFVNDPRLSKNSSATGVVKLEVEDGFGNRVTTTRRIQVSIKEKTHALTKKELDATLRKYDKNGKRNELSSKCADIKTEMCRVMGVSEAVLNHVILCHQEDSCWPLDEAKKVKEKFDSIFNTTMYIKCLDHLNKKDKELGQRAKLEAVGLEHVVNYRNTARRKRKDVETKEIELKSVMDQIVTYEKELRDVEEKLKVLQDMEREHVAIESKVAEVSGKLQMLEKQVLEMKKNIKTEFDGDIVTLEQHIEDFERKRKTQEDKLKTTHRQLQSKEDEVKKITQQQKSLLVEEGKFQQEENANKERLEMVKSHISGIIATIKKLKDGSQNTTFSNSMDSCLEMCEAAFAEGSSNDAVIKALSTAVRVREAEVLKTKIQFEKEEKDIQTKIDKLRSKRAGLDTEISMKKQQIEENKTSMEEIKDRLRVIDGSNETLALLSDDEQKCMKSIEEIEKSGILDKCTKEIKSLDGDINKLEHEISELSSTVDVLTEDKGICDQINSYNRQKIQKQNECNEIMRRIEDDLKLVLGEIPEANLCQTLDKKRDVLAKELNQKRAEQRQKERDSTVTETELKRTRTDMEKKEKRLEFLKEKVSEVLEDEEYETKFESVAKLLDKKKKENYYSEAARFLYKKYIQKLNKKDCCPLCKRDLETRQKVGDLIKEIEAEIEKIQESEPRDKIDIERLSTSHHQLQELKPLWDEKIMLEKDEIPALKTKKISLEHSIREIKDEVDDIGDTVGVLENDHSIAVKCAKDSALFENASKDVKRYEESITKLEKTRNVAARELQGVLSLSDAKTQLQGVKTSQSAKKMEKESKRDMLTKKQTELTRRKDEKNKIKEEILKITADLRDRDSIEGQKKDLEEANKNLQMQISDLTKDLPKAKLDITEAENSKTECINRKEDSLSALRSEREMLEKQKTKLSDLDKQIQEFEQKKSRISDVQKRSAECKRKIEEVELQRNELRNEIDSMNKLLSNHKLEKRNLEDNLTLKQNYEEVKKLKVELSEKNRLLAQTKNRGVATERREQSLKHQELSARMNKDVGQKKQIMGSISELKRELNEKILANAEKDYIEKFVRKTVLEKTQQDVRKYRSVLDNAIMTFHAKRMQTINSLLKKYWTEIYKGNDIDSIQIQTDNADNTVAPGTGKKIKVDTGKATRKVYNYRVVSIRQKHELDMRGRCSAGQRVLASIIIRIALAETFSSRCGVITLDEPTTNLDKRNINSLADALAMLAQRFSARKNFQLIVITHDQEFVERLSQVDAVEKYWKIDRDPQGFSRIYMVKKRGT